MHGQRTPPLHPLLKKKKVGLLLPLFSLRSERDWGVGDISSMSAWLDILASARLSVLEILPVNEMPPGVNCPYTALSAFAVDPVYLDPEAVEELAQAPRALALLRSRGFRLRLNALRKAKNMDYDAIRGLKRELLSEIYAAFSEKHILPRTAQGRAFTSFCARNAYWLDDYALFRALKEKYGWISWTHWDAGLKNRNPDALAKARTENAGKAEFFKYLQWLLQRQWNAMHRKAKKLGISLFGDLPFMVNQESADIWARQNEFDISVSIGAPPDTWTPCGQKWGLPACRWPQAEKTGFEWWRLKLKKAEELYDIYRIDHMVGFFRTWIVPENPELKAHFDLEGGRKQENRGRRFLQALRSASKMLPVGEDLGLIPPYVGKVLADAGVPGYKVLRWEKTGENYTDTAAYYRVSLATTCTHDMEPLAVWWECVDARERALFWKMVSSGGPVPPFEKAVDPIIKKLINSGSRLVILPFQDVWGLKDRINTPNTVGPHNWSFRPDTPVEKFRAKHGATLLKLARWIREAR